ncbi:alpha/beta fold hydrolase [Candidatus Micrarchaeota archaeon]|nr:alpha/beta fold hydrolase [Candidatus Micrarchaeota archaeon]
MEKSPAVVFLLASALIISGCLSPGGAPAPASNGTNSTDGGNLTFFQLGTPDGWMLPGFRLAPAHAANGRAVILLHALGRDKSEWASFANSLAVGGYDVFAMDLRGHGDSGVNGTRRSYGSFDTADFQKMAGDAGGLAQFIRSNYKEERISIVGASIGANAALNYAARDAQVGPVVLLSPGLDYRGVQTPNAMNNYSQSGRKALLVASGEDEYAAFSSRQLKETAGGNAELAILQGAGHGTEMLAGTNGRELSKKVIEWLGRN